MKKNLVKKALLPAIVAVLCSLIALTSVSYAWFTMGNEAQVGQIDVNVTAADGLQISADAATWKSVLPVASLEALESNQFLEENGEVFPVSSAGNVVAGKLQLFKGEYAEDKLTTTAAAELGNEVNFIAFDLYVKLDSAQDFKLSSTSTVTKTGTNNTHTAVRVAFVKIGTAQTKADVDALAAGLGTANAPETALIWEPNAKATAAGSNRASKEAYKGVNKAAAAFDPTQANDALSDVTTFELGDDAYTLYEDLGAGITKIRVYIWLEGQDVDCINDISGDGFAVNLQFEIPEDAQATN